MPAHPLAFPLAAALLLAGCTSEPPPASEPPPQAPPPGTPGGAGPGGDPGLNATSAEPPVVQTFEGSAAGAQLPVGYVHAQGEHVFAFDVAPGAVAIVLEAAWDGPGQLDLLPEAPAGACQAGADPAGLTEDCPEVPRDTDGASPAFVVVTDPALLNLTGSWTLGVWAKQSPQPVPFRAAASVFYAAPPPQGYTALGPPGPGSARAAPG